MASRRRAKRANGSSGGGIVEQPAARMTGAIVLIALGAVLLLSQNGVLMLQGNWWAILIALPAIAMLYTAYTAYRRDGAMTAEVGSSLSGAIVVGTIAVLAALNQMALMLPLLLIEIGVLVALGWRQPRHHRH